LLRRSLASIASEDGSSMDNDLGFIGCISVSFRGL